MTYEEAVKHYQRPVDLARALKLDRRTINSWKTRRIPSRWQARLEYLSKGALKADDAARSDADLFAGYNRAREYVAA